VIAIVIAIVIAVPITAVEAPDTVVMSMTINANNIRIVVAVAIG